MPTIEWNRDAWGTRHTWALAGDEWNGMARYCGQPYDDWKSSLAATFLLPYIDGADVLEIAPGKGRWSEFMAAQARSLTLVDINENCLDACRQRFASRKNLTYQLGDGLHLPGNSDTIDFVWSFDSFVHMDPPVFSSYIAEISRVLRPGGRAVLHHADKYAISIPLARATERLGRPGKAVQTILGQGRRHHGNRSHVTRGMVYDWARASGLDVSTQTRSWGPQNEYNVQRYRDIITVLRKP